MIPYAFGPHAFVEGQKSNSPLVVFPGPSLPEPIGRGSSVPYKDSFAIVGGINSANLPVNKVFLRQPDGQFAELVNATLSIARRYPALVPVDKTSFPSC